MTLLIDMLSELLKTKQEKYMVIVSTYIDENLTQCIYYYNTIREIFNAYYSYLEIKNSFEYNELNKTLTVKTGNFNRGYDVRGYNLVFDFLTVLNITGDEKDELLSTQW